MPVSYDRFVRALTGKVTEDLYKTRRGKCIEAMKEANAAVKSLPLEFQEHVKQMLQSLARELSEADQVARTDRKAACEKLEQVKRDAVQLRAQALVLPRANQQTSAPSQVAPSQAAPSQAAPSQAAPSQAAPSQAVSEASEHPVSAATHQPVPEPTPTDQHEVESSDAVTMPAIGEAAPIAEVAVPSEAELAEFQQSWAALEPAVTDLEMKLAAKLFGENCPGPTDELEAFTEAKAAFSAAKEAGDYCSALDALPDVEYTVQELIAKYNEAKSAYETQIKRELETLAANVEGKKYGDPPIQTFNAAVSKFNEYAPAIRLLGNAGKYFDANSKAEMSNWKKVTEDFSNSATDFEKARAAALAYHQKLSDGVAAGYFASAPQDVLDKFSAAKAAADLPVKDNEYGNAQLAIDALIRAAEELRTAAFRVTPETSTPIEARSKLANLLHWDPEILKSVIAQPGGSELIDTLVANLGSKATGSANKQFVEAAITARFGPKLTGDKGGTYLCKLYKVLHDLPASHTNLGQSYFSVINRERKLGTSEYAGGTINLRLKTGLVVDTLTSAVASAQGDIFSFDFVTLHEVGHAVDDSKKFMLNRGKELTFGGWVTETVESVAEQIGEGKQFFQNFNVHPKAFLRKYLEAVLQKKDPAKLENGLPSDSPAWKELAKHDAVKHCKAIRLQGTKGLWDGSPESYAVNGRIFQESYAGKWVSYLQAARVNKVSNYQFRSDAEWYAEVYACFFTNRLKANHPLYPILNADKEAR